MTGPGSMLKSKVPLKTWAECDVLPGFVEIDLIGHDGGDATVVSIPHHRPRVPSAESTTPLEQCHWFRESLIRVHCCRCRRGFGRRSWCRLRACRSGCRSGSDVVIELARRGVGAAAQLLAVSSATPIGVACKVASGLVSKARFVISGWLNLPVRFVIYSSRSCMTVGWPNRLGYCAGAF
jgi:hypothetical protein